MKLCCGNVSVHVSLVTVSTVGANEGSKFRTTKLVDGKVKLINKLTNKTIFSVSPSKITYLGKLRVLGATGTAPIPSTSRRGEAGTRRLQ